MKTKNTFLNFYLSVLNQVKFDHQIFWKEYQKALVYLDDNERIQLNNWVYSNCKNNEESIDNLACKIKKS
jgi:transglutaminase/protease-like cytokinesis protein 3